MLTRRISRPLAMATAIMLLAACGKSVELRQRLDESDANEILSTLAQYGIRASKQAHKDGLTVSVAEDDFNGAIAILREAGLPRRHQASLGEIFRKEGMVSTPIEERARYIYALSQELERTLLEIDGVISARVHVVLPERVSPGDPINPSSAAVFIKYRPNFAVKLAAPRISQLVAHSIPGLSGAEGGGTKVSLILLPAQRAATADAIQNEALERRKRGSKRTVASVIGSIVALLLLALAGILWRLRHKAGGVNAESDSVAPVAIPPACDGTEGGRH